MMLLTTVLVTLGVFPIYLLLRAPFRRLPLHIDTGFYVSNHTVATGRIVFAKGWNSHFAACSKLIPELFYSLVYLFHDGRRSGAGAIRDCRFKHTSRLYASLYNYLTAIALGILACQLAGGDVRYYYAGLVVFSLLSSEAQYGVYFECAELFGILGNVVSMTLLVIGIDHHSVLFIGLAAFVWAFEACFVKLSSAIAFVIVFATVLVKFPMAWAAVLIGGGVATALYLAWIVANGRRPVELLRALGRHERSYGQRAEWRAILGRMAEKCRCLARTFRRQPLLPSLAMVGALLAPPQEMLVWVYLLAVLAAYAVQAADCWYYQIPLLPPMALLAGGAVVLMAASGQMGVILLLGAGAIWLTRNSLRAARLDIRQLNLWCWKGYRPVDEISGNVDLEGVTREIASVVAGQTLLVYGPFNQAYVLLHAGYSTPIVAPEFYMDDMCAGWQRSLNRQLLASPAAFIFDTSNSFAADTTRRMLGLDYHLTHVFDGRFRLYHLRHVSAPREDYESACTYQPQPQAALIAEEKHAGADLVVDGRAAAKRARHQAEPLAAALEDLLDTLAQRGYQRIGIYGAGRFTIRHREVYRRSKVPVVVVLDDRPSLRGETFLDWPIRKPEDADQFGVDAAIISTDRFRAAMLARARRLWNGRITIFTIEDQRATPRDRQRAPRPARTLEPL